MPLTSIQDLSRAKDFFEAKMAFTIGPVELERLMKSGKVNVVDVRAADDYAQGHIPGAVSLPKEGWSAAQGLRTQGLPQRALLLFNRLPPGCHGSRRVRGPRFSRDGT